MAASSAVSNVPSHTRAAFFGSRISAAHFPHGLCRTPRYLRFFTGVATALLSGSPTRGEKLKLVDPAYLKVVLNLNSPISVRLIWEACEKRLWTISSILIKEGRISYPIPRRQLYNFQSSDSPTGLRGQVAGICSFHHTLNTRSYVFNFLSVVPDRSGFRPASFLTSKLIIRGSSFNETIVGMAFPALLWVLVVWALVSMRGTIFHLASHSRVKGALQFLGLYYLASMINGAHADNLNEDFQSWAYAYRHIWELIRHVVKTAVIALMLDLLIFRGAYVVRRMFNYWSPVEEPNEGPNEEQVEEAAAEAEPALPLYPFVEGNDFDAVMARAPVPDRRNSPLGWL